MKETLKTDELAVASKDVLATVNITKLRQKMFTQFYVNSELDASEIHKIIDNIFAQTGIS